MSLEGFAQYPGVDVHLVERIVCKLKSQGIFDQFRKDCLADVDTKPAYQNLQQRVNGSVATFLQTQAWQQNLNKTQLRESLRRHVQQKFLEVGVDRIVDQVVNPKVYSVFMPQVEDVVYDCLGIEKPQQPPPLSDSPTGRKLTLVDLLPKDLDPVSPDSDNLSFADEDETKDEANNNENSSRLDMSVDSEVSGISDLSSHMGNSLKENQEDQLESNTLNSVSSAKENSSDFHFENFENLSEKIKQAEIGHNPVSNLDAEVQDTTDSKASFCVDQGDKAAALAEVDSIPNHTFQHSKIFNSQIIKEDTSSRTAMSEDSLSCSSFNSRTKKKKSKSLLIENFTNSLDKSYGSTPHKEYSSEKDATVSPITEQIKAEPQVPENKDSRKIDEVKEKKHHDSSSSSSKTSRSSSDKHRNYESKHRSSTTDRKDDSKHSKEKTYKEEKDKEKLTKDEKEKSSRHKDDRHSSSKDKYKRKDKTDSKDNSEKEKKSDKEQDKDKYIKDKDKNEKEKSRSDKERERYDKEKDKDRYDREKGKHEKSKHDKEKRDKDKERQRSSGSSKEKDKSRDRERSKSEKDSKVEKEKESNKVTEDKSKDDKKKDPKKYDRSVSSSSSKKEDTHRTETKNRNKRNEENGKEKNLSDKAGKSEEERRERKRKSERCNEDIKLKEARRSWDRDSSGGNGKSQGSLKSSTSEIKASTSSGSTKEKRGGESSNQQKTSERSALPGEPSDVDKILMKINSSIEESQNVQSQDEQSVKKPKIARNIFEIKKIMQARKNLARQLKNDKKKRESLDSVQEAEMTDSPSTHQNAPQDKTKIREENKENIKAGQLDKMKNPKIGHIKGQFSGFLESDIEKSRNSLEKFRSGFTSYCQSLGFTVTPTEGIQSIDYTKLYNDQDGFLDDNLNKLKPKAVSLERRKTFPQDTQVSKVVENIMSGKNGCYVLLQDCTQVVEAMKNASPPKQQVKQVSRKAASTGTNIADKALEDEGVPDVVWKQEENVRSCTPEKQPDVPRQEEQDEPSSPGVAISVVLNPFLNDSVLNNTVTPASVPLTEAMLDSLMKESSILVEEEHLSDSDDSDYGYREKSRATQVLVIDNKKTNIPEPGDNCNSNNPVPSKDVETKVPELPSSIDGIFCTQSCEDVTSLKVKGPLADGCENKSLKRRNQRLSRSASQRYDSTDLYKPRPVLPHNSKRTRAPCNASSEESGVRGQSDQRTPPPKKRSR